MIRVFLISILFCHSALAASSEDHSTAEFIEHILGYLQKDYGRAVKGGEIISSPEYQEQLDFISSALASAQSFQKLPASVEIQKRLTSIQQKIATKADSEDVSEECRRTRAFIVEVAALAIAPAQWPDREHGKELFQKSCAACHGASGHGDGPSSPGQDPPPADFHDPGMSELPPFQAYNTIRMGVPGTPMPAFASLSTEEAWDLAFYVVSLRYLGKDLRPSDHLSNINLKQVASLSDDELRNLITGTKEQKDSELARLRLLRPTGASFIPLAKSLIEEAYKEAAAGNFNNAKKKAVLSYLDGVEPIEPRLRARAPEFTIELEEKMAAVRTAIEQQSGLAPLRAAVDQALQALNRADEILDGSHLTPTLTFTIAAGIFLREAFEAALILITLLGVIRSIGSKKAALYVHGGWLLAVGAGLGAWFFSGWVMAISGQQREYLEGGIAFLAVIVLLYFGFWLHQKTEIGKWRSFIDDMVKHAIEGKNLLALGTVAFMAVFREAFETVLFLRALLLEAGNAQSGAMLGGVLFSLVLVLALAWALLRFSARLPIRQLFNVSSMIMVFLALILIGKGVHSFQETGLIGATPFPGALRLDLFGLYPTYETLLPQAIILVGGLVVWCIGRARLKRQAA